MGGKLGRNNQVLVHIKTIQILQLTTLPPHYILKSPSGTMLSAGCWLLCPILAPSMCARLCLCPGCISEACRVGKTRPFNLPCQLPGKPVSVLLSQNSGSECLEHGRAESRMTFPKCLCGQATAKRCPKYKLGYLYSSILGEATLLTTSPPTHSHHTHACCRLLSPNLCRAGCLCYSTGPLTLIRLHASLMLLICRELLGMIPFVQTRARALLCVYTILSPATGKL